MSEAKKPKNQLPKGILLSDLKYPSYKDREGCYDMDFELWFARGIGWVIPTLHIRNPGRRSMGGAQRRTYAVGVADGKTYRVGLGPHVEETWTVYARASRKAALMPFVELKNSGEGTAGQIRDRISSRRAQGAEYRAQGRTSWRWDA